MKNFYLWIIPLLIPIAFYTFNAKKEIDEIRPLALSEERFVGKLCKVHPMILKKDVVPLTAGLMMLDQKGAIKHQASLTLFPRSAVKFDAGCVIEGYSRAEVIYCEECRKAEASWDASH